MKTKTNSSRSARTGTNSVEKLIALVAGAICVFLGGIAFRSCFQFLVRSVGNKDWVAVVIGAVSALFWAVCALLGASLMWCVAKHWDGIVGRDGTDGDKETTP